MKQVSVLAAVVAVAMSAAPAQAAVNAAAVNAAAARAEMQALASGRIVATVPHARQVIDRGIAPAQTPISVSVWLNNRNQKNLGLLTWLQSTRGSYYYNHYLTNAQWNAYFAPALPDVWQTAQSLVKAGFKVTYVAPNHALIQAVAPAGVAARYFHTEIHSVFQQGYGMRYANVTPAVVPAELRSKVAAVTGLHNLILMHTNFVRANVMRVRQPLSRVPAAVVRPQATGPITTNTPSPNPSPDPTEQPDYEFTGFIPGPVYCPRSFLDMYHGPAQHGYGGHGVKVANVISGQTYDSDIAHFAAQCGIPTPYPANIRKFVECPTTAVPVTQGQTVAGCENASAGSVDAGEAMLDSDAIRGMAPAAQFIEYLMPDLGGSHIADAWNMVASDNVADVLTMSIGGCETDDPTFAYIMENLATQLTAKGITPHVSTGDNGALGCGAVAGNGAPGLYLGVDAPASSPHVVAVGGTSIQTTVSQSTATGDTLVHEGVWVTSGGGVSVYFNMPAWQSGLSATSNPGLQAGGRNLPDVVMPGDPNMGGMYCYAVAQGTNGGDNGVGGTSESSPLQAGVDATMVQIVNHRLGWLQPRIYAIYNTNGYNNPATQPNGEFFDINDASNNGFYTAVPGYDDAGGIGVLLGWEMAGTL